MKYSQFKGHLFSSSMLDTIAAKMSFFSIFLCACLFSLTFRIRHVIFHTPLLCFFSSCLNVKHVHIEFHCSLELPIV